MSPEAASVTGGRRSDHVDSRFGGSSHAMIRCESSRFHIGCTETEIHTRLGLSQQLYCIVFKYLYSATQQP